MNNNFDLNKIYGIPPARYSEDDPNDLFLNNIPSLEQIASFNLAMRPQSGGNNTPQSQMPQTIPYLPSDLSTPATTIGGADIGIPNVGGLDTNINQSIGSASAELPFVPDGGQNGNITQQITDFSNPYPVTAQSIQYLNGFIRTQIGRRAQIQFLMGNSELITRDGYLLGVGSNYILINEIGTNDITACDFYNIKFIRFLY